jgi:competence protein ComEA
VKSVFLCAFAVAALAQTLPEGPGKAVTQKMCTPCHTLDNVVKARLTKERWAKEVDDMVTRGATGTDDEIDQVIDYLATNFPPGAKMKVNVNKAAASDLVLGLGISAADAATIVKYRTANGKFKEFQDLTKVPGIDAKKIENAKDRIEF